MANKTAIITGGAAAWASRRPRSWPPTTTSTSDVDGEALAAAVAEIESDGGTAEFVVADITDRAQVDAVFAGAAQAGGLRAVVHAAGVSPRMGSAEKIIEINAVGTINVVEAALAVADEGFAVVNVASIAAVMVPGFMIPKRAFGYARTDVDKLRQKLIAASNRTGKRAAPSRPIPSRRPSSSGTPRRWRRHWRVGCTHPVGFAGLPSDTEMGRLEESGGSGQLTQFAAALKRFGRPEEIAELSLFCASSKPGYLTGVDILRDGGTKAGMGLKEMITLARGA